MYICKYVQCMYTSVNTYIVSTHLLPWFLLVVHKIYTDIKQNGTHRLCKLRNYNYTSVVFGSCIRTAVHFF